MPRSSVSAVPPAPTDEALLTAPRIQAIIAAGVADPSLLASWQSDPRLLQALGLAPDALDLSALRRFVGLTTKVRHNDLRRSLPLTFRLMDQLELSIEIFADYAARAVALKQQGKTSRRDKLESLLSFLAGWVQRNHAGDLVWDMIRHERWLGRLAGPAQQVLQDGNRRPGGLTRCPGLVQEDMTCRPPDLALLIRAGGRDFTSLPRGEFHFVYWRGGETGELHIAELDDLSDVILRLADGTRCAGDIAGDCASAAGGEVETIASCIRELIQLGLAVEHGA